MDIKNIVVKNLKSSSGREVPNQFQITVNNSTSKYRNIFLGETTKETLKKIKSGEYKLVNLNKEWNITSGGGFLYPAIQGTVNGYRVYATANK